MLYVPRIVSITVIISSLIHQIPQRWNKTELLPSDTLAGTAVWLIQKETQDIATNSIDGMYDWII